MLGKKKKSIHGRLTSAMIIVAISVAACGALAIFSILYIKTHIDALISQTYTGTVLALGAVSEAALVFCIIIGLVVVFAIMIATASISGTGKRIQQPIDLISSIVQNAANTGSLQIPADVEMQLGKYVAERNDEVSDLIISFKTMNDGLINKVQILELVAQGDLRHKVIPASEADSISNAINDVVNNLSMIVSEVVKATEQLSAGANELSSGAQTLSQSASQQSATMDELHVTAAEIATEAEENAGWAADASKLTSEILRSAAEGGDKMVEMNEAMKEINKASHAIGSVMKAIDEIAFQTNILALNAAVEAARAGVHGKGFAVVADEVRNLATKSGTAANDSNVLIADTIVKSDLGNKIVDEAIAFFKTIEDGIANTSDLLDEIAKAAKNQSDAIDQINNAITDMTNTVYHNSATSEQSAAASEQMYGQAVMLRDTVKKFLLDDNNVSTSTPANTLSIEQKQETPYIDMTTSQSILDNFMSETEPEVIESVEIEPQIFEPVMSSLSNYNPTNESQVEGKRSPAEIYAEALGREAPGSVTATQTRDKSERYSFSDDTSKY